MRVYQTICLICLLGLSLGFASCSSGPAEDNSDNRNEITLWYHPEEPMIETGLEMMTTPEGPKVTYRSVTVPGSYNRIIPGEPVLPMMTARILIPFGEDIQDIKVVAGEKKYLGKMFIEPGQAAVPINCIDRCGENYTSDLELTPLNETVYASADPYPEEVYSMASVQEKCGYKILYINLYPVRYIPNTRETYYFGTFGITVTTTPAEKLDLGLFRGSPQDREVVDKIVDNPEAAATYPTDVAPMRHSLLLDGEYDYVIITSQYMKDAPGLYNFQALADHKDLRGVNTTIVTVEDIYEAYKYDGVDKPEKIRLFIKDAYLKNNITYVLLGGDGDGANIGGETMEGIVPTRLLWACGCEEEESCKTNVRGIASDLYYACLNGTYDSDGNGTYGELVDNVDLQAEVYVGRAPVDTYDELSNFVRKTILYESTNEDEPYLRSVWMVGEYLGYTTPEYVRYYWGGDCKDQVKAIFPQDNFSVQTLYDRNHTGCDCDIDDHNWPKSELMEIINDNTHTINHMGNPNFCEKVGYVMKMGYNDADALTNDKPFFGYSQASYAGAFDNRNDNYIYLPHDCVLEHFVTAPCGAFGFIGNSRSGWWSTDIDTSPSQRYDMAFWEAIFAENATPHIGRANQDSKEVNVGSIGEYRVVNGMNYYVMRYCYYAINLLGDPETPYIIPPALDRWSNVEDAKPFNGFIEFDEFEKFGEFEKFDEPLTS
ncbi:hypothetical protein D4R47_00625 [archaeon]|nr:MAG: hypothetical protein D4R47_00625 [archaeon]